MSTRFNVIILGAGRINFGSTEASWNHSLRLERILKERLNVVALVDVNTGHAENILNAKRASGVRGYEGTKVFKNLAEAKKGLGEDEQPKLVVNGLPANFRGTTIPDKDTDCQVARLFPTAAQFIEKPISGAPIEEVEKVSKVLEKGGPVSVGYMTRYLKAVTEMKRIIKENNLSIMYTQATYLMAYKYAGGNEATTYAYWDKDLELGPIVGQGTHLVDLSRYFCPDPIFDSLRVHTVEPSDKPGKLSQLIKKDEAELPPERRIPRVTNAIWRYESGATGSMIHGVCLHEGDYDCELSVIADGWKLRLVDPYGTAPKLYVRRPGTTAETRTEFTDDDFYYNEFSDLIDVIEGRKDKSAIRSDYADAMDTYKFTWAIRWAGEEEARRRGALP